MHKEAYNTKKKIKIAVHQHTNKQQHKQQHKQKHKQKHVQFGGDKIGYGGFGCVITPPIKCSSKSKFGTSNYVSKLLPEEIDQMSRLQLEEELYIYKILRKIDPRQYKFVYPVEHCIVTDKLDLNRPDIKLIQYQPSYYPNKYNYDYYINNDNGKPKKASKSDNTCYIDLRLQPLNMIFKHAGDSLDEYFTNNTMYVPFFKKYYRELFCKLIGAVRDLHHNSIAHMDIKLENITCNHPTRDTHKKWIFNPHIIRIIDFGLSFYVPKHYTRHIYHTEGTEIPLDLSIAKYVKNYELYKINETIRKLKYDHEDITYLWNISDNDLIKSMITRIEKSIRAREYDAEYKRHITGFAYKTDVYALGVTFAMYLVHFNIAITPQLEHLLFNMMNVDPWARYSIDDCMQHPFYQN
jgi:serine/threonine protein kinase